MVDNTTAYKFGKKEVKLTGFPRYDRLLINNNTESKQILIMPTWRSSIVGTYISGTERTRNPDFMKTNYAKHWHGFMNHAILKELNDQGYQIVFAPHPSIQEYMDEFTVPDFIKIYSYSEGNIQSVFQNTSILITDYSSVAFDVAYLNKAILYYQFDYDEVFSSGNHTYQKGYFDYNRDGFGAVAYNETEILAALKDLVDNQAKVPDLYQTRIDKTFQFRDSNNCERVYQAILDLDKPELSNDLNYIEKMILQVENLGEWVVAASRIAAILENTSDLTPEERANYINRYLNALFKGNKFIELLNWLEKHPTSDADYWRAKVSLQIGNPTLGIKYFSKNNIGILEDKLIAILAASLENNVKSVKKLNQYISSDLSEKHHLIQLLAEKILQKEYFVALALIETLLTKFFTVEDKKTFKLELLASYLCMRLNNFQQAHKYLVRYEGYQRGDIACRIAIARLAKLRQNGEKLFTQLNRAFGQDLLMMPQDLVPAYLQELHNQGNTTTEKTLLEQFTEKYPDSKTIASYKAAVKEEK
nr:CDP-glycerol glycerophosphotransferase family protein [Neisseria flavescens]